ncbi:VOC family protein [Streptomyces sp. NPDC006879]|uniref:VOC family protein n=1 Tax=Streptomyces sp. NPDC006879 TaxID=3364767 RepID=UPI0036AD1D95
MTSQVTSGTIPDRHLYAAVAHLVLDDADAMIRFCGEAFGARPEVRVQGAGGEVLHAELRLGGSVVIVCDAIEGDGLLRTPVTDAWSGVGSGEALRVFVPDVDALTERAVAAGAELLQAPADMFYGERTSVLRDPKGHTWVLRANRSGAPAGQPAGRDGESLAA